MTETIDAFEQCYTGAVYDCLRERGIAGQALPAQIAPLIPGLTVAGPAFTVTGNLTPEASAHETLIAWTSFLSAAPAGSVVVFQPNDHTLAYMGELSAQTLQRRGIRGCIVDGGCRDTRFIKGIGFPVWCRYRTPVDVVGQWTVTTLGDPVHVGGTLVRPGDFVVADDDGVLVVPAEVAEDVAADTLTLTTTESLLRREIRDGKDPREAYLAHGVF